MLRQLRLCRRFDALILFGCRPSVGLGLIHGCGLPDCNHRRVLSDLPAARDPRLLILNLNGCRTDGSFVTDAKTMADSYTSTGRTLRVSFGRAAPPASSFLYYDFPDSTPSEDDKYDYVSVTVAHKDSVLLQLSNRIRGPPDFEENHSVYTARAGADGPPTLSRIPVRDFLLKSDSVYPVHPRLDSPSTGLLRRGENDLLVVQMELGYDLVVGDVMEFCVLRPGTGMCQWELKELAVPILLDDSNVVPRSSGEDVIPVGNQYLCWVNYKNGLFLCDMADEARPKVRYVPVPAEVRGCCISADLYPWILPTKKYTRKMGATGASSVRFVSVDPHSRFAFTVRTWTMDLSMDGEPLAWVKGGEMNCEEIWALPGYEGLP